MRRYNKSEIVRHAHYIKNHSCVSCSMSQVLKESWKEAKKQAMAAERFSSGRTENRMSKYDKRNACEFKNVIFGRNDWGFLYGRKYNFYK